MGISRVVLSGESTLGIVFPGKVKLGEFHDPFKSHHPYGSKGNMPRVISLLPGRCYGFIDLTHHQKLNYHNFPGYPKCYCFGGDTIFTVATEDSSRFPPAAKHFYRLVWNVVAQLNESDNVIESKACIDSYPLIDFEWGCRVNPKEWLLYQDFQIKDCSTDAGVNHFGVMNMIYLGEQPAELKSVTLHSPSIKKPLSKAEQQAIVIEYCPDGTGLKPVKVHLLSAGVWSSMISADPMTPFKGEKISLCLLQKTEAVSTFEELTHANDNPVVQKVPLHLSDEVKKEAEDIEPDETSSQGMSFCAKDNKKPVEVDQTAVAWKTDASFQSEREGNKTDGSEKLWLLMEYAELLKSSEEQSDHKEQVIALSKQFIDNFMVGLYKQGTSYGEAAGMTLVSLWRHVIKPLCEADFFKVPEVADLWCSIICPLTDETYIYIFYLCMEIKFNEKLSQEVIAEYERMITDYQLPIVKTFDEGLQGKRIRLINDIRNRWQALDETKLKQYHRLARCIYNEDRFENMVLVISECSDLKPVIVIKMINLVLRREVSRCFKFCFKSVVVPDHAEVEKGIKGNCVLSQYAIGKLTNIIRTHEKNLESSTKRRFDTLSMVVSRTVFDDVFNACYKIDNEYKEKSAQFSSQVVRAENQTEAEKIKLKWDRCREEFKQNISQYRLSLTACSKTPGVMNMTVRSNWVHYLCLGWTSELDNTIDAYCRNIHKSIKGIGLSQWKPVELLLSCFTLTSSFAPASEGVLYFLARLYFLINQASYQMERLCLDNSHLDSATLKEISWWLIYHNTVAHPAWLKKVHRDKLTKNFPGKEHIEKFDMRYEGTRHRACRILWNQKPVHYEFLDVMAQFCTIIEKQSPENCPELMHQLHGLVGIAMDFGRHWFRGQIYKSMRDYGTDNYKVTFQQFDPKQRENLQRVKRLIMWAQSLSACRVEGLHTEIFHGEEYRRTQLDNKTKNLKKTIQQWLKYSGVDAIQQFEAAAQIQLAEPDAFHRANLFSADGGKNKKRTDLSVKKRDASVITQKQLLKKTEVSPQAVVLREAEEGTKLTQKTDKEADAVKADDYLASCRESLALHDPGYVDRTKPAHTEEENAESEWPDCGADTVSLPIKHEPLSGGTGETMNTPDHKIPSTSPCGGAERIYSPLPEASLPQESEYVATAEASNKQTKAVETQDENRNQSKNNAQSVEIPRNMASSINVHAPSASVPLSMPARSGIMPYPVSMPIQRVGRAMDKTLNLTSYIGDVEKWGDTQEQSLYLQMDTILSKTEAMLFGFIPGFSCHLPRPSISPDEITHAEKILEFLSNQGYELPSDYQRVKQIQFFVHACDSCWEPAHVGYLLDKYVEQKGDLIALLRISQLRSLGIDIYQKLAKSSVDNIIAPLLTTHLPLQDHRWVLKALSNNMNRLGNYQKRGTPDGQYFLDERIDYLRGKLYRTKNGAEQVLQLNQVYFELMRPSLYIKNRQIR